MELTQERLKQLLNYKPETGEFCWVEGSRKRGRHLSRVGHKIGRGYLQVMLDGRQYLLHRLAWMFVYGSFPDVHLDHINGNPTDNRIENLRCANFTQNNQNRGRQSSNKCGFKGVYYCKKKRRWVSQICANKKKRHLGVFSSAEEAYEAYCVASRELHAEFSNID